VCTFQKITLFDGQHLPLEAPQRLLFYLFNPDETNPHPLCDLAQGYSSMLANRNKGAIEVILVLDPLPAILIRA